MGYLKSSNLKSSSSGQSGLWSTDTERPTLSSSTASSGSLPAPETEPASPSSNSSAASSEGCDYLPIHLVIEGAPVSQKNQQQIVVRKKKGGGHYPAVSMSKRAKEWHKRAEALLAIWKWSNSFVPLPIERPVNVRVEVFVPDLRTRDLANFLHAPVDALVRNGVLSDDDWRIVAAHDGSRMVLDRRRPRVEITIEEVPHGAEVASQGPVEEEC